MHHSTPRAVLLAGMLLFIAACSQPVVRILEPAAVPSGSSKELSVLAGEWEYEDGAVVTLRLDEQGNGTYGWKEGRFETRGLTGQLWQGLWYQEENDREGGFTVELSPDFSEGEGRWWYTRIGQDLAPSQRGGTFHLTKRFSQARAGDALVH